MEFRFEVWSVRPVALPRVKRHCSGCGRDSAFVCSEKFRANANKKRIDVWLIYRCADCAATWNFPIVTRQAVRDLERTRREAYETNDIEWVRRHAFDLNALRRHVTAVEQCNDVEIKRSVLGATEGLSRHSIRLEVNYPCAIRLDRLLSSELGLSRTSLQAELEVDRVSIAPAHAAFNKSIKDGTVISFHSESTLFPRKICAMS